MSPGSGIFPFLLWLLGSSGQTVQTNSLAFKILLVRVFDYYFRFNYNSIGCEENSQKSSNPVLSGRESFERRTVLASPKARASPAGTTASLPPQGMKAPPPSQSKTTGRPPEASPELLEDCSCNLFWRDLERGSQGRRARRRCFTGTGNELGARGWLWKSAESPVCRGTRNPSTGGTTVTTACRVGAETPFLPRKPGRQQALEHRAPFPIPTHHVWPRRAAEAAEGRLPPARLAFSRPCTLSDAPAHVYFVTVCSCIQQASIEYPLHTNPGLVPGACSS